MKRLFVLLAICASAFAQESQPRVVEVKNLDINQLGGFLGTFRVKYSSVPGSRFIALQGNSENVKAAEEALKRIDNPRRDIEFTFQILSAGAQPASEKLPADLEPVVKQLKGAFVYQAYHLIETMLVKTSEGSEGRADGILPRSQEGFPAFFQVSFQSASLTSEPKASVVHLQNLNINGKFPYVANSKGEIAYSNAGIRTDVDVKEGQKVVVGKANMDGKDGAIFMIVTARIVD